MAVGFPAALRKTFRDMKLFLPIVLGLACIALIISLIQIKKGDNAQHEHDVSSMVDFSNRLDLAETHLSICHGMAIILTNSLNESRSTALTFSNQLLEAQSSMALGAEQITSLNRQVANGKSENQALDRRVMDLTNQIAGLTRQLAVTAASLAQTNSELVQAYEDYSLLENRFRIDVAERTVVERKFNNFAELKAQTEWLKAFPAREISAASIYAGLNVEVKSNGSCRVIAPN